MLSKLIERPRTLFVIDGFGALISAFFLGFILVRLEPFIGMPRHTLFFLASFPLVFALLDVLSYFQHPSRWKSLLRIIAIANILYICISLWMLFQHASQLSVWGYLYFMGEIFILAVLIIVEFSVANEL